MMFAFTTKLLVIDQDVIGEKFLEQALITTRYQLKFVHSTKEALNASLGWNPDVIIINLMQPSSDGWKLCQKLRRLCQSPILVLAAVSDPNSIAQWLDAGADDYLTKPFSREILIAQLKKITRRSLHRIQI